MLTENQLHGLETIERVASCFSVIGTTFIFFTFISSSNFRRPINRLVFYASWGNLLCNIATLMSTTPPRMGAHSHLCQFQAFIIQMFVPADAFWNLAMALNVYLTLFRKYNAQQLKALEWRYLLACYGGPFIVAFALIFAESRERGKVYGNAVLWCWISKEWDFLRVVLCYAPAWVCIIASFAIYLLAGREIFEKRHQLRVFKNAEEGGNSSLSNYKTTNVEITSSEAEYPFPVVNANGSYAPVLGGKRSSFGKGAGSTVYSVNSSPAGKPFERYTVNIASLPIGSPRPSMLSPSGTSNGLAAAQHRRTRAALEANRAAWGYTKVALLFFVSLLVTWVPSSVNRVYGLIYPGSSNVGLAYTAGLVLSLMGFWNSVIYVFTSRAACKELFFDVIMWRFPAQGRRAHLSRRGSKGVIEITDTSSSRNSPVSNSRGPSPSDEHRPSRSIPLMSREGGGVAGGTSPKGMATLMPNVYRSGGSKRVSWNDEFERLAQDDSDRERDIEQGHR